MAKRGRREENDQAMTWIFRCTRRRGRPFRPAAALVLFLGLCVLPPRSEANVPRLAVFDFEMINTSLEPTRPDEERRLRLIDDELRNLLRRSGRFELIGTAEAENQATKAVDLRNCNGCEVDIARRLGADEVMTGTVQKVSNLILNINLYARAVPSGERLLVASVDIRGNTDEMWLHGVRYLVRHRVLGED
jgi:hypothetical protein